MLYRVYWAPSAEVLGKVEADTPGFAKRLVLNWPKNVGYKKYPGDVGVDLEAMFQGEPHGPMTREVSEKYGHLFYGEHKDEA